MEQAVPNASVHRVYSVNDRVRTIVRTLLQIEQSDCSGVKVDEQTLNHDWRSDNWEGEKGLNIEARRAPSTLSGSDRSLATSQLGCIPFRHGSGHAGATRGVE